MNETKKETYTKHSDTEIKIVETVDTEQVVTLHDLKDKLSFLTKQYAAFQTKNTEQGNQFQTQITLLQTRISEAEKLGITE